MRRVLQAARAVFGVDGAGLMFLDGAGTLRYAAAIDESSRALETAQEELGRGPCVDALVLDRLIATADLADDPRWPQLAARLVPLGVRALLGVPVHLAGAAVGSLNVYGSEPRIWSASEQHALIAYAGVIESLVASALELHRHGELVAQLQHALEHR